MKLLAFTDVHGDFDILNKLKKYSKDVDITVCAGDITWFSANLKEVLQAMNEFESPVIFIHGNHESPEIIKKYLPEFSNLIYLHNGFIRIEKLLFMGYGEGGFSRVDKKFEKLAKEFGKEIKPTDTTILITHAPPYNTALDRVGNSKLGVKSIRRFIENNKISLCICGHIHENEGKIDKINNCIIINPGPFGAKLNTDNPHEIEFLG